MKRITTQGELYSLYSQVTGLNKSSSKMVFDTMAYFLNYCIENNIEFKNSSSFELYYSIMKERETTKIVKGGSKERVILPPVIKAKLRLADSLRRKQGEQSAMLRPILEKVYGEIGEDLPLTEEE